MHKNTFGSSPCALRLVELLQEQNNPALNRRVTRFLVKNFRLIKAIDYIPERAERLTLATMLKNFINNGKMEGAPLLIETFSKNVAITALRSRIFDEHKHDDYIIPGLEFEFDFEDEEKSFNPI